MLAAVAISFVGSVAVGNRLFNIFDASIDVWFDSDTSVVFLHMTDLGADHGTLYKHPLFSIILWPLTALAQLAVGDSYTAVRVVQAANAGLVVVLLWTLFARIGVATLDRTLLCLLFLASSTMLFWFTVPESFPFGATTLLFALHIAISPRPRTFARAVGQALVSVGTLSMTITNWVGGLVATAVNSGLLDRPLPMLRGWAADPRIAWKDLRLALFITCGALVIAVGLALLQDAIFYKASMFINVSSLIGEAQFIGEYGVSPVYLRPFTLLIGAIVAGTLTTWHEGQRLSADTFIPEGWVGLIAFALWTILLVAALYAAVRRVASDAIDAPTRRLAIATLVTLAFMVVLHSLYGFVAFLYVAHMVPFLMALMGLLFVGPQARVARVLVALLIVFAGIHNYGVFQESVAFVHANVPEVPPT